MRLLIVEDDFVIVKAIAKELEKYEHKTMIAEDFLKIMKIFQSYDPYKENI